MKKRMKICGIIAAAAVLLVTAVLVTTCMEALTPEGLTQGGDKDTFVPPPGKGYVQLNASNDRTIRPDGIAGINISDGTYLFDVRFIDADAGDPGDVGSDDSDTSSYVGISYTSLTDPIPIDPETYNIEVYAYVNVNLGTYNGTPGTITTAVLFGTVPNVTIQGGVGETEEIILREITNIATGKGLFKWNITSNATIGTMTLTKIGTGVAPGFNARDLTNDGGSPPAAQWSNLTGVPIDTGFYNAEVSLSRGGQGSGFKDETFREIIHIYQGMSSTWTRNKNLNPNIYNITYNYNNAADNGGTALTAFENGIEHGDTLLGTNVASEPTWTGGTQIFVGWYTTTDGLAPNGGGTNWSAASVAKYVGGTFTSSYRPVSSQTIYGKWGSPGFLLTFDTEINAGNPKPPSFTYTYDTDPFSTVTQINRNDPKVLTITIVNDTDYPSTTLGMGWGCDDPTSHAAWSTNTTKTLTIDFDLAANFNLLTAGSFTIYVYTNTGTDPTKKEQTNITITVANSVVTTP